MANTRHNPPSVPFTGKYSLAVEVPAGARTLYVSGQVCQEPAGKPIDVQCHQAFKNIGEVLKGAGMDYADIAKIVVYLTDPRFIPVYREVKDAYIKEPYPASTLLVIDTLAAPEFLVEIEVVAAK
jgi:2-iminobutanoate/2-iminopropanoate deaminase